MSDQRSRGGIFHLDVAMMLVGIAFLAAQVHAHAGPGALPLFRDLFGFWVPVVSGVLWLVFRRRAFAAATAWPLGLGALVLLAGIAVVFWRWGVIEFVAAMAWSSVALVAGLMLRARHVTERPSRIEVFSLVAAGGSMVLTVVLVEVVLRLVPGAFGPELRQLMQADVSNYGVADPYIGYLHHPNSTIETTGRDFHSMAHVDGLGFRNATWPWPARADIVTVGDSLTFGYGVSDDRAWPATLAGILSPLSVVNLGLIGAGPQQYQRLYERYGVPLHPKVLLVGFFGQNDFWDAGMFDRWLRSGDRGNFMIWRDFGSPSRVELRWRAPVESLGSVVRWSVSAVLRRSYLYHLLQALHRSAGQGAAAMTYTFEGGRDVQLFEQELASSLAVADPSHVEYRLTLDALAEMHRQAVGQGTCLIVVLQPGKEEVYLPLLGRPALETSTALKRDLDRLGIGYLDLLPAFRERAAATPLFFEADGHPNGAGYDVTANLVAARLRQEATACGLTGSASALSAGATNPPPGGSPAAMRGR